MPFSGSTKRVSLALVVGTGSLVLGIAIGWQGAAPHPGASSREPSANHPAPAVASRHEAARLATEQQAQVDRGGAAQTDGDRGLKIRNIGLVPFEVVFELLQSAPEEARSRWVRQLAEMPPGRQRSTALTKFYTAFGQLDAHAAASSVQTLPKDAARTAMHAIVEAAPVHALAEVAKILATLPQFSASEGMSHLDALFDRWSMTDPVAAAKFVERYPALSTGTLLYNWAQTNPNAALQWFLARPNMTDSAMNELSSLVQGWYRKDKAAAVAFTLAHPEDAGYEEAQTAVARQLFMESRDEARDFLLRLPADDQEFVISEMTSRKVGGEREWIHPPEETARWLLTFPGHSWRAAAGTFLFEWQLADPGAVSSWIARLPPLEREKAMIASATP